MIYFLILIFAVVFNAFVAGCFGEIAKEKGFDRKKYFWLCFWLSFAGFLMVVALPDRKKPQPAAPQVPDISYAELPEL